MIVVKATVEEFSQVKAVVLAAGLTEEQYSRAGFDSKFLPNKLTEYTVSFPETDQERYALFADQYANCN